MPRHERLKKVNQRTGLLWNYGIVIISSSRFSWNYDQVTTKLCCMYVQLCIYKDFTELPVHVQHALCKTMQIITSEEAK